MSRRNSGYFVSHPVYFFVPRDLLEKILSCRLALDAAQEDSGAELQRKIDAAAAKGGGRVTVGPGVHDCGTLWLKSGVELHLEKGAVLRGPSDWRAYDDVDDQRIGKRPEGSKKVFIAAFDAVNVAITGEGTIDGQGLCFYDVNSASNGNFFAKPPHPRPRMLEFFRCKGVRLEGVELKDSPGWTCWLRECEDVVASHLRVHGDQRMINNDGLHVDGCRHVRIGESEFKTGDDCIIMRANVAEGRSLVCEDMVVSNCVLDSNCQCIRLSCPSDDLIRNGLFKNLKMSGSTGVLSHHPARYVVPWNEGCAQMEDIVIEDCEIDVRHHPVYFGVDPGVRLRSFGNTLFRNVRMKGGKPIVLKGTADAVLRNIRFENVTADIAAEQPVETSAVEGLAFENCRISSGKGESVPFKRSDSTSWESRRW